MCGNLPVRWCLGGSEQGALRSGSEKHCPACGLLGWGLWAFSPPAARLLMPPEHWHQSAFDNDVCWTTPSGWNPRPLKSSAHFSTPQICMPRPVPGMASLACHLKGLSHLGIYEPQHQWDMSVCVSSESWVQARSKFHIPKRFEYNPTPTTRCPSGVMRDLRVMGQWPPYHVHAPLKALSCFSVLANSLASWPVLTPTGLHYEQGPCPPHKETAANISS